MLLFYHLEQKEMENVCHKSQSCAFLLQPTYFKGHNFYFVSHFLKFHYSLGSTEI